MKFLRDYKGVIIIYLLITVVNIIWFVGYEKPENKNIKVDNTKTVAVVR